MALNFDSETGNGNRPPKLQSLIGNLESFELEAKKHVMNQLSYSRIGSSSFVLSNAAFVTPVVSSLTPINVSDTTQAKKEKAEVEKVMDVEAEKVKSVKEQVDVEE
ncbi:hypothetical protein L1987_02297 [Smallanthus sonchifolius]|uniref:Uncharacterized protein n=1 Tax=Smallanthus sonchifolius TaxID=185202 RepID=A0ACB9K7M7_9ASTR|nr:hypothetical protein L1987_02297 [Smallanthus sonchifolius]